jgi:diguanylate cyclase (GGDEF)-like protein
MEAPEATPDEPARLAALRALGLLDSEAEERFDRLTRLARRLLGTPIALVSLVDEDRQWFKSRQGIDASETPRSMSFCAHAIHGAEPFVVDDATEDVRFADNPLFSGDPHIRFYAGCPISAPDGSMVGTLCVLDRVPRHLDDADLDALRDLAALVEDEIAATALASTDPLTGINNRRGFEQAAQSAREVCRRAGASAVVLVADLDDLKEVNDDHGHEAGDKLLVTFAHVLSSTLRAADVVGRLGGDEFAVLLSAVGDNGADAIRRLRSAADATPSARPLRFSIGAVTAGPDDARPLAELLAGADAAMYEAKRAHRRAG